MGHLSKDDEITQRGANPRTGVISPYILSDAAGDSLDGNYVLMGDVEPTGEREKDRGRGRGGSGRWKQDSLGWSLVDESLLSPAAEAFAGWQDAVAVGKAPLDERELVKMKKPLKAFNQIPRKEIGSGVSPRKGFIETVTDRCQVEHPAKLRVGSFQTQMSVSPQNFSFNSSERDQNSKGFCRASKAGPHSPLSVGEQMPDHTPFSAARDTRALLTTPQQSPLKVWSPSLYFLHPDDPTHFSYPAASYRRPQHLLPAYLRATGIKGDINGKSPDNANNTSHTAADSGHRPQVRRKNGATTVPKLIGGSTEQKRDSRKQLSQSVIVRETDIFKPGLTIETLKSNTDKIGTTKKTMAPDTQRADFKDQRRNHFSDEENMKIKLKPLEGPICLCSRCNKPLLKKFPSIMSSSLQPCLHTRDIALELFPKPQQGSKPIEIYRNLGSRKSFETMGVKKRAMTHEWRTRIQRPIETDPNSNLLLQCSDHKWPCSKWAELEDDGDSSDKAGTVSRANVEHLEILLQKCIEAKEPIVMTCRMFYAWAKIGYIYHQLLRMIRHIFLTLYNSSTALEVLSMPCTRIEVYVAAIYELFLAISYLLMLLNTFVLICRVFAFVAKVFSLIYIFLRTIVAIIRWCTLGELHGWY